MGVRGSIGSGNMMAHSSNGEQRSCNGVADGGGLTCTIATLSSLEQRNEISDMQ